MSSCITTSEGIVHANVAVSINLLMPPCHQGEILGGVGVEICITELKIRAFSCCLHHKDNVSCACEITI